MNQPLTALMTIDFKKGRIRIHKESYRLIGSPRYVHFLVSVEKEAIAIRGVDKSIKQAGTIRLIPQLEADYDVHCTSFLNLLASTFPIFKETCTYRVTGTVYENERTIIFPVQTGQKYDPERIIT